MRTSSRPHGLRRLALAGATAAALTVTPPSGRAHADAAGVLGQPSAVTTVAPGVTRTTYPGGKHTWAAVNVLRVDPDIAPLTLRSSVGAASGAVKKVSQVLGDPSLVPRPAAGVNGSFFDDDLMNKYRLPEGDPEGVSVQQGVLLSEASGGGVLLMQHGRPYITTLKTDIAVSAGGASTEVHGINRHPGRIPWERPVSSKGNLLVGFQGDLEAKPDTQVFANDDEIVLFTPEYGIPTPGPLEGSEADSADDPGVEVVVDRGGTVRSLGRGRGGTDIPPGGKVLQGIGAGADWLTAHARVGSSLTVTEKVTDLRFGDEIPLSRSLYAVSGRLIMRQDGKSTYSGSGGDRHARTVVGVDGEGKVLLVTVDADDDRPGMDYNQLGDLLAALDATDALNIDGGGSTTLVVDGALVNKPSDGFERPVSDMVQVTWGGYGVQHRAPSGQG
ncbi:phosphodiester glycosidase family protein [Kitasatospora sp. NPDC001175]|uniref:phosphodiester glycosidase family protein n=1 Tax=Kitasatospora sp. NPDC001175 TaxID=3157103 RepID=UPI003CFED47F